LLLFLIFPINSVGFAVDCFERVNPEVTRVVDQFQHLIIQYGKSSDSSSLQKPSKSSSTSANSVRFISLSSSGAAAGASAGAGGGNDNDDDDDDDIPKKNSRLPVDGLGWSVVKNELKGLKCF